MLAKARILVSDGSGNASRDESVGQGGQVRNEGQRD